MHKRLLLLAAIMGVSLLALGATRDDTPGGKTGADDASKAAAGKEAAGKAWVEPMKKVHANFKGDKGTFAHFGDSITVTMAFWSPLVWNRKNMDEAAQADFTLVKGYMKEACWREWKGPAFGSEGSMTIRWAFDNVDKWLGKLNPEAVLIMFGTNDVGQLQADEYETKYREVARKCLDNGAVVILSTIPPKHGQDAKVKTFNEVVHKIAQDMNLPVCDYYGAIMSRRPDDWDGAMEKFKGAGGDVYQVPTLISGDGVHPSNPKQWDGDYSDEGLKHNGYVLRSRLALRWYAEVIREVLKPEGAAK